MTERWVGIDVGLANLAVVKANVNIVENTLELEKCMCVDLTRALPHNRVNLQDCKLFHTKDAYDRVAHFLQEYEQEWMSPDVTKIFIERQPITGLVHVEQLLFGHFRNRAELVSPNAMHKWLNINHLTYEQRKQRTVEHTESYFAALYSVNYYGRERKHDMADALCLLLYKLHLENEKVRKSMVLKTSFVDFEQFRFKKVIKSSDFLKCEQSL